MHWHMVCKTKEYQIWTGYSKHLPSAAVSAEDSLHFNFAPLSVSFLKRVSLFPMAHVSLRNTTSHLVPRLHETILLSELLPHKLAQSDDSWMPSDRPCICSAVNYSASSIFTSLREVWKPLASPLSVAPAVSHHQSLVSWQALLSDRL